MTARAVLQALFALCFLIVAVGLPAKWPAESAAGAVPVLVGLRVLWLVEKRRNMRR